MQSKLEGIPIINIQCCKCGRKDVIRLQELWKGFSYEFEIKVDKLYGKYRPDQGELQDGIPCGVIATCACGNEWKLHKVNAVTELDLMHQKKV